MLRNGKQQGQNSHLKNLIECSVTWTSLLFPVPWCSQEQIKFIFSLPKITMVISFWVAERWLPLLCFTCRKYIFWLFLLYFYGTSKKRPYFSSFFLDYCKYLEQEMKSLNIVKYTFSVLCLHCFSTIFRQFCFLVITTFPNAELRIFLNFCSSWYLY